MKSRKGKAGAYSYLPGGEAAATATATKKAVKGILAMANMHLPACRADADEEPDPVESNGFSAAADDVAVEESDESAAAECTCDACRFVNGERRSKFRSPPYVPFTDPRVFQSQHDGQSDLYAMATTSRGARASTELRRFAGRMRF